MSRTVPRITRDDNDVICKFLVSYWDDKKRDRFYIRCKTEKEAQVKFTEILVKGNYNVIIYKFFQTIDFSSLDKDGRIMDD